MKPIRDGHLLLLLRLSLALTLFSMANMRTTHMNKEVKQITLVCTALLCAVIWTKGKGTTDDLLSTVYDFYHKLMSMTE